MKKLAAIGVAVGLIVGLAGCSTEDSQKPPENEIYVENSFGGGSGSVTVVEVTDKDRTVTCAVLVGHRRGGISCDWANAKSGE